MMATSPTLRRLAPITAPITAAALLLSVSGCAGVITPGASGHVDLDSPAMRSFAVASMTDLERDVRIETGSRKPTGKPVTPPLFWTGIGLGTVGAVGAIGFGVAGLMAKNDLNNAYYDGSGLTRSEQERLVERGETFNTMTYTFVAVSVIGYALALVAYAVDWNRCGPLAEKRRRCKQLP
jgi:hypothetical protein